MNRTGYALIVSTTFSSAVGFGFWLLAARLYPVDVVGRNAAAIAAMTMLAGLAILFLDGTMVRFIPRAGPSTRRLVVAAYAVTAIVATVLSAGFVGVTHFFFQGLGFLSDGTLASVSFVLFTVSWCIFIQQDAVLTGLRRATWIPLENGTFALLKIALLAA